MTSESRSYEVLGQDEILGKDKIAQQNDAELATIDLVIVLDVLASLRS